MVPIFGETLCFTASAPEHTTAAAWRVPSQPIPLSAVLLKMVRVSHLLLLCLTAGITYLFFLCGWYLDYNPTLIIAPVIFPITFTISSAYRRREDALTRLELQWRALCSVCSLITPRNQGSV